MDFVSNGRVYGALVLAWLPLFNGCVTYAPNPVDWEREQKNWHSQNAEPATLTLGDFLTLANVANPEVNRVRMRHANLKRGARAAGWWEDPSLDAGVSRLLKGGGWTRGAGVSLVVPLTGIPGLERKAAEAYAGAGAFEVLLAERKLAADVREAWVEWAAAKALLELREGFVAEAEKILEQAEKLANLGELPREEFSAMQRIVSGTRAALVASRKDVPQKRAALLELAGIHPAANVVLMEGEAPPSLMTGMPSLRLDGVSPSKFFDEGDLVSHPAANVVLMEGEAPPSLMTGMPSLRLDGVSPSKFFNEGDLVSHPAVMAKLAEFNATEQQLRIEIKKQWPEVSLGPTVEHDGELKGGLAFGVTLPLWNRNRAGIASAEGLRDEARQECVDVWRSLVYASHRARAEIETLEAMFAVAHSMCFAAMENHQTLMSLDALGETDLQMRFESMQMVFETMERCLELEMELAQTNIRAVGDMLANGFEN